MVNYFIGWTQADLEAELRSIQEDMAAGNQVVSVGAGDTNVSTQTQLGLWERWKRVYYALFLLDSTTYPFSNLEVNDRTVFVHRDPENVAQYDV